MSFHRLVAVAMHAVDLYTVYRSASLLYLSEMCLTAAAGMLLQLNKPKVLRLVVDNVGSVTHNLKSAYQV